MFNNDKKILPGIQFTPFICILAVLVGFRIYFSSAGYPLFHLIIEIFSIFIGYIIFIIIWNTRRMISDTFLIITGISFLFISSLDFLHSLFYKDMAIFPYNDANIATQLWISTRYLQAFSFLAALIMPGKKKPFILYLGIFGLVTSLILAALYFGIFPDCFVEGSGLTMFKIVSEYIIILLFLASALLLVIFRKRYNSYIFGYVLIAFLFIILSEFTFTLYNDVFDIFNTIGHFLKVIALYCFYRAFIITSFKSPVKVLFYNLEQELKRLTDEKEKLAGMTLLSEAYEESTEIYTPSQKEINDFMNGVEQAGTAITSTKKTIDDTAKIIEHSRELLKKINKRKL